MSSKSDKFETELLQNIFNSAAIGGLGTDIFIALHTSDPGEGGNQQDFEANYTGYARVQMTRADASDWAVTGNTANPVNDIQFPPCTGGNNTITHFSIGKAGSGASDILYYGPVTPPIAVSDGVTPSLTDQTAVTED